MTTPNPWESEISVTAESARRLISRQFPGLAGFMIAPFGSGWDNTGFLVDKTWVFRFPRRRIAVPLLRQEIRCLSLIAPRLPIRIPSPEFVGIPTEEYPYPFVGYRLIPGTTACVARLDDEARTLLADEMATFLHALHHLPQGEIAMLGVIPDQLRRLDVEQRTPTAIKRIDAMVRRGDISRRQADAFARIIADAIPVAVPTACALVHGDLYVRHLIVGDHGNLNGVIDWGDLHLGVPAMDLMAAFLILPPEARLRFFATYGDIDEDTRRLARFRAVVHLGCLLEFGHATHDQPLVTEMRRESINLSETVGIP